METSNPWRLATAAFLALLATAVFVVHLMPDVPRGISAIFLLAVGFGVGSIMHRIWGINDRQKCLQEPTVIFDAKWAKFNPPVDKEREKHE